MKKLLLTAGVIILAGIIFIAVYYRMAPQTVKKTILPVIARQLEFELNDAHYTHTKSGRKRWELTAAKAQRNKGSDNIILTNIHVILFAADGSQTVITADQGSYNTNNNNVSLTGHTRIKNATYTITTEELTYLDQQEKIIINKPVTISRTGFSIEAQRASMEVAKNRFHFSGGVKAHIKESPKNK
ncbi:MAG TPA: LPS export ABC transporter periplasmic protein LptC [Proteobacteria bacterium]|nr:LPS export ABC transporter periplasmic protein LptC [Pseudomonadota bacterium]